MAETPVSVVVLTFNEEINLESCLASVKDWASEVVLVDSYSTDGTLSIAGRYGASVYQNKFMDYSSQRNWALRNIPYKNDWILFLDADEYITDDLKEEILRRIPNLPVGISGVYLKRRLIWMGKWIKHGGVYPLYLLRLVRHRNAHCNPRPVNEHLEVDGETVMFNHDIVHDDRRPLSQWTAKHNRYAYLEAHELLQSENRRRNGEADPMARLSGGQAERKRWIRERIWNPLMPPLVRPFIWFIYRYFILVGFLDGVQGFVYHFLQGLWYTFLTDVYWLEMKSKSKD